MDAVVSSEIEIDHVVDLLSVGLAAARRRLTRLDAALASAVAPVRVLDLVEGDAAVAAARANLAACQKHLLEASTRRARRLGWALRWPAVEAHLAALFLKGDRGVDDDLQGAEERLAIAEAQASRDARNRLRAAAHAEQKRERDRLHVIDRWFSDLIPRLRQARASGRVSLALAGPIDLRSSAFIKRLDAHLKAAAHLDRAAGAPVSPINNDEDHSRLDLSPRSSGIAILRPETGVAPWMTLAPDDRIYLANSARPVGGLAGFRLRGRAPRARPGHLFEPRERRGVPKLFGSYNGQNRIYLPVPLERSEEVIAAGGAMGKKGGLYADPRMVDFGGPIMRFLPFVAQRHYLPLQTDLIPKTSWGASLANLLSQTSWDRIRTTVTSRYGGLCQICGQLRGKQAIECHEVWDYEPERRAHGGLKVQRLVGLMSVCRPCHGVFHLGFSETLGRGDQAQYRLSDINGWTMGEEEEALDWMVETYEQRSREWWALDLSLVAEFGLIVDGSKWTATPEGGLLRKKPGLNAAPTRILGASWKLGGKGQNRACETDMR